MGTVLLHGKTTENIMFSCTLSYNQKKIVIENSERIESPKILEDYRRPSGIVIHNDALMDNYKAL